MLWNVTSRQEQKSFQKYIREQKERFFIGAHFISGVANQPKFPAFVVCGWPHAFLVSFRTTAAAARPTKPSEK